MRISVFLTSIFAVATLCACGATPPKTSADNSATRATSTPTRPGTGSYARYPAAEELVARLHAEHGLDPEQLRNTLSRAERQQWILELVNRPAPTPSTKPTGSWTRYSSKFLNEDRISKGVQFWGEHAEVLERASRRYGVPPEYVVAIIGVETHYGRNFGKTRVIDALATLAFDYPRRGDYFTKELGDYLVMTHNEGLDPFGPRGSYAGAMGYGQFMPSSFLTYAVDFNGDGKRNLWDPEDAIGSVANYFKGHDWRGGEAVAIPARAQGTAPQLMKADFTTSYRVEELAREGVTSTAPLDGNGQVSLLRLDGVGGFEYWLGLHNFYVITRYNHSTYYAMSVHQLAQQLRSRRGPVDRPLISWLQRLVRPTDGLG